MSEGLFEAVTYCLVLDSICEFSQLPNMPSKPPCAHSQCKIGLQVLKGKDLLLPSTKTRKQVILLFVTVVEKQWSGCVTLRAVSVAAAVVAAARASGGTKGLQVGTLSSSRLCAKKQICRLHLVPSLHSCVRYLHQQKVW